MKTTPLGFLGVFPFFLLLACGTDNYPIIELSPAELCEKTVDGALVNCSHTFGAGPEDEITITIKNTGERDLLIKSVELTEYSAEEGAIETEPGISLVLPEALQDALANGTKFYVAPSGAGTPQVPDSLSFTVKLFRPMDNKERKATLVIRTDASNSPEVKVSLMTPTGAARIVVNPEQLDFGTVGMGEVCEEKVTILNEGTNYLLLKGFKLTGSPYYTLIVEDAEFPVKDVPKEGIALEDPLVVLPGNAIYFKVRFEPLDSEPCEATLTLWSNDPVRPQVEVEISGNEPLPCIAVNPEKISFGAKHYGELAVLPVTIKSCSEAPLELYAIYIKEGSSPNFAVNLEPLGTIPSHDSPVVVPPGAEVVVNMEYVPNSINPLGPDGTVIMDEGVLVIENNSLWKTEQVNISGMGVDITCPIAVIRVAEGEEVAWNTVLHLYGDESYSPNGPIVKWEWNVDQPHGSWLEPVFVPSSSFPNPMFKLDFIGLYKFHLTVYDETNTPSCFPAEYEVMAFPDGETIHIELLWHTPNDPDVTDTGPGAGTDLDLHFLHPWAAGPDVDGDGNPDGWFDLAYDCFWYNPHPNWGSYDPDIHDNPSLDVDDSDGAGPENIVLMNPENVVYRVGVYYWDDHGYGPSFATVMVHINWQLVFWVKDTMLINSDMWEVCTIEWPSGKVEMIRDAYGNPKIIPNYRNPYFHYE